MPGSWKQVGQSGAWHRTTAATGLQGKLYTTESNGGLYATDVTTGHWKQIGKQDFVNTRFLIGIGNMLYSIERSGTLLRINPSDGSWETIGQNGAYRNTTLSRPMTGALHRREVRALIVTDPSGQFKSVGKAEFANTVFMNVFADKILHH